VRPAFCAPRLLCAPPFVRCLIRQAVRVGLVAFSLLAFLTLPARAGQWAITYSNTGKTSYDAIQPPASLVNYPSTNAPASNSASVTSGSGKVDFMANASIVATLTWQPASGQTKTTDPPTSPVSILQTASATEGPGPWNGPGPVPAGTAADGLGDPRTMSSNGQGYFSSGVHLIQKDGSSGVITPDPVVMSASCPHTQFPNGSADWVGSSGVNVKYTVAVSPVFLNLGGTLTNGSGQSVFDSSGNQQILIGQGCSASFSGGSVSNFQWSVSGSNFQDWEPTTKGNQNASPPIAANSQASYYDPGPGVQTNPTYHWYWNDLTQTTETVKCTATVTPPAGQGSPYQMTATQKVIVYVPAKVKNTNEGGNGLILKSIMIAEQTSAMMNNLEDFGSSWTTAISMPPTPAFGAGQWCYCQLITPGEYVSSGGAQFETTETQTGAGLDAAFPYNNPSANAAIESADGNIYYNGDSPRLGPLDSTYDSATLTDSLSTYLTFQPPANSSNDVRWVALSESTWATNFSAQQPAGGWSTYSSTASVGPINPSSPQFVSGNTFPKWTQIVQSGQAEILVPYH
jgi:hypothetical protein